MIDKIKHTLRPLYVPVANWYYKNFKAPKRYHHLFDEIKKINAHSILEVGTWNGERALKMIKLAQENSTVPVKYIGFDLFEDLTEEMYRFELSKRPPTRKEVEEKLFGTGAAITLVQGNTLDTLPKYVENSQKVDFVFIDGGHHVATIQSDWNAVSQLMHEDTVVIFDDYWRNRSDQSAKPVVDSIDKNRFSVEILPEIDSFDNPDFGRLDISFAKVTLKR